MSQFGESFGNNLYYGNAGGGGGYLTGGSPFGSASGSPGGASRRGALGQSLRPLTVMQVHKATQAHTDADWMVDNTEIGQITIVGKVITIRDQTTNSLYTIDDGTGQVEARYWSDSTSQEGDSFEGVKEGNYVRVSGTLKTYGSKRYINTAHIRLLKDWPEHELFFHIAETMAVTLMFDRGPPSGPDQAQNAPVGQGQTSASAYTAAANTVAANDQYAHLPPLQRNIIHFITAQPFSDDGVHASAISRGVKATGSEISSALEKLTDDGLIYTTSDDMHFNVSG
ncbi:hypothetical protein HETIRDRAFT_471029 [Heterobasidion irregulare TC 32-1]|uniref:Replication protein A C-terminal domain-containing protein n=1 Tax=Heterobasidion irregulare (strain TC 32-1) TaxID=747525 RepID=W4KKG5_HETIT|nr:uncharacterized protein HETIRDRAFT_471029 [Heterobasidion irregulare TC 32-1]ETW85830.1 hypothetical protein HETIRDRAFT_471029 [Heterobasidion irregulare TC 32-1]